MPGNYADTSNIVDGQSIDAADVKVPIDALDDKLKEVVDDVAPITGLIDALSEATFVTIDDESTSLPNSSTLADSLGSAVDDAVDAALPTALGTALASPPAIGSTTANTGRFTTVTATQSDANISTMLGANVPTGKKGGSFYFNAVLDRLEIQGIHQGTAVKNISFNPAGGNASIGGSFEIGGNMLIGGALSKGSGTFRIVHPLDENYLLYHSFIEGPRCDLIYRGEVALVDGIATVDLNAESRMRAGTFEALTQNPQILLQNVRGWEPVRGHIIDATLYIECKDENSSDTVSWMVIAERADDFIKEWELTDEDGRFIPEHPREAE